jgi:hypothetical protein
VTRRLFMKSPAAAALPMPHPTFLRGEWFFADSGDAYVCVESGFPGRWQYSGTVVDSPAFADTSERGDPIFPAGATHVRSSDEGYWVNLVEGKSGVWTKVQEPYHGPLMLEVARLSRLSMDVCDIWKGHGPYVRWVSLKRKHLVDILLQRQPWLMARMLLGK